MHRTEKIIGKTLTRFYYSYFACLLYKKQILNQNQYKKINNRKERENKQFNRGVDFYF